MQGISLTPKYISLHSLQFHFAIMSAHRYNIESKEVFHLILDDLMQKTGFHGIVLQSLPVFLMPLSTTFAAERLN